MPTQLNSELQDTGQVECDNISSSNGNLSFLRMASKRWATVCLPTNLACFMLVSYTSVLGPLAKIDRVHPMREHLWFPHSN